MAEPGFEPMLVWFPTCFLTLEPWADHTRSLSFSGLICLTVIMALPTF